MRFDDVTVIDEVFSVVPRNDKNSPFINKMNF